MRIPCINIWKVPGTQSLLAIIFLKKKTKSVSEDVEKLEFLCITVRMEDGAAIVENTKAVPQKIKHRLCPTSSTPENIPE